MSCRKAAAPAEQNLDRWYPTGLANGASLLDRAEVIAQLHEARACSRSVWIDAPSGHGRRSVAVAAKVGIAEVDLSAVIHSADAVIRIIRGLFFDQWCRVDHQVLQHLRRLGVAVSMRRDGFRVNWLSDPASAIDSLRGTIALLRPGIGALFVRSTEELANVGDGEQILKELVEIGSILSAGNRWPLARWLRLGVVDPLVVKIPAIEQRTRREQWLEAQPAFWGASNSPSEIVPHMISITQGHPGWFNRLARRVLIGAPVTCLSEVDEHWIDLTSAASCVTRQWLTNWTATQRKFLAGVVQAPGLSATSTSFANAASLTRGSSRTAARRLEKLGVVVTSGAGVPRIVDPLVYGLVANSLARI